MNPIAVLKVDAPEGVAPGDLVELRIVTTPAYAENLAGGHGQARWGARVWPAAFKR